MAAGVSQQSYLAVCTQAAGPDAGEHNLGPAWRNEVIARLWLANYLS